MNLFWWFTDDGNHRYFNIFFFFFISLRKCSTVEDVKNAQPFCAPSPDIRLLATLIRRTLRLRNPLCSKIPIEDKENKKVVCSCFECWRKFNFGASLPKILNTFTLERDPKETEREKSENVYSIAVSGSLERDWKRERAKRITSRKRLQF